jgi:flagellar biosynthesis protein FlhA
MTDGKSFIVIALGVIAILAMLIMPMPTVLLDGLIMMNMALSLLIVFTALFYTKKVKDIASFPTMLLAVSIFQLALNTSSIRLILTKGAAFDGKMIKVFSSFTVSPDGTVSSMAVSFVIFIICAVVQTVVIKRGAARIEGVAARFRQNILPEKLAAIAAKLDSGAVSEEEAADRKNNLRRENDFYEALDGASKFSSGGTLVVIILTAMSVAGGILIGTMLHGEEVSEAVGIYTPLSVGNGFLFLLPILLISTSVSIIVTGSVSERKKWPD